MATIHFTGDYYSGSDGVGSITLRQPGHYQVSDAQAAQLVADYPQEFSLVHEGEEAKTEEPAKAPSSKLQPRDVAESPKDTKPAQKASKKAQ